MLGETYEIIDVQDAHTFYFMSEGKMGQVPKLVLFRPNQDGFWELSFGDFLPNGINVKSVTNNYDAVKVVRTVMKTIILFFDNYSEAKVYFKPVDAKRNILFKLFMAKYFRSFKEEYKVKGVKEGMVENYDPNSNYQAFFISKNK